MLLHTSHELERRASLPGKTRIITEADLESLRTDVLRFADEVAAAKAPGGRDYIRFDRAELIEQARRRGTYDRFPAKLLVEDPHHPAISPRAGSSRRRPVETLNPRQRRHLFICSANGLEPAALWLNRHGLPVMPG